MVDHQLLTVDYFPVVCYKLAWDQAPQWWKKAKQGVWGGPFPSQDYLSALLDCQFFLFHPRQFFLLFPTIQSLVQGYSLILEEDKRKEQKTKKKKEITDTETYFKSKPENSPMRNLQALIVVGGE